MKKVLISFAGYAEAILLQVLRAAINSMTGKEIFTNLDPTLAAGLTMADEFEQQMAEASNGGRSAIASKNLVKKQVVALLRSWAIFINMIAKGNPQVIADSGLPTAKQPQPSFVSAVTNIKLIQGVNPGTLDVSYKKPAGVSAVICSYTNDPITKDSIWLTRGTKLNTLTLLNLQEGTKVWVKFTSIGSKGAEAVGESVSGFVAR